MKPTYYAAKASAHRVHARYAKAEADNALWNLATWIVVTAVFAILAVLDPSIARFAFLAVGAIVIVFTIQDRRDAQDRYHRHALDAEKYTLLTDQELRLGKGHG